jgi:alpha-mannosidase
MAREGKAVLGRRWLAAGTAGFLAGASSAQPTRVYICPDDHTDYIWTASESAYRQAFVDMLDFYLNLGEATATNPPDYRSRWHCDGTQWLWEYERNRTPAQFQRLMDAVSAGTISCVMNPLVVNNGGSPAEAVVRGMYYAGRLERRFNTRFRMAIYMENQTFPLGLPSLWAGSGALYSWKGVCDCDTQVSQLNDRDVEVYRAVGKDGRGVLMKWNSIVTNQSMGGYAEARFPAEVVDYVTVNAPFNGFAARWPYGVVGAFGKGWDDFQTYTSEFITTAQSTTNASRRVIVSNALDFFQDFDSAYGPGLPSKSLAFGNEWDAYAASMPALSADLKRATERLRVGEALAVVASAYDPAFMASRTAARDTAFMALGKFFEHNMGMVFPQTGAGGVTERLAWQARLVDEAASYAEGLVTDGSAALGRLVPAGGAPGTQRFFVFNPLSWVRSGAAELPVNPVGAFSVYDAATGAEVPSQRATSDAGAAVVSILASNVPSVGYRVFEVRPVAGQAFGDAATVTTLGGGAGLRIENSAYRVTVAPRGAITSIADKSRSDREFVSVIGGRAANDLGAGPGTLTVENVGPVSVTVKAVSASPVAHETFVTVYRGSDRIDIRNRITAAFNTGREWAFSFNLATPELEHEELGAIIKAKLATQGGDYSSRSARYDLLTLNHFADLAETTGNGFGVTLANEGAMFMRRGNSTVASLDTTTAQVNVIAGGQVVNGSLGLPSQGLAVTQRFALRTRGGGSTAADRVAAMRLGLELSNPMVRGVVTGTTPKLPEFGLSLLTVSDPGVMAWAFKPAEDGAGAPGGAWTVRLWNVADSSAVSVVQTGPLGVDGASRSTHIETLDDSMGAALNVSASGFSTAFQAQEMRTFRLDSLFPRCRGDLDGVAGVNTVDLTRFLGSFGAVVPAGHRGDLNGDGVVNTADLTALLGSFGTSCP